MSTHPARRRVVLPWMANQFEPGRDHREREVTVLANRHYEDYPKWRRFMVDEGWLQRARNLAVGDVLLAVRTQIDAQTASTSVG